MHLAVDAKMLADGIDVFHQFRRVVSFHRPFEIGMGRGDALPASALVEEDDTVTRRIEITGILCFASPTGAAMQKQHRLAIRIAVFHRMEFVAVTQIHDRILAPVTLIRFFWHRMGN